jgi:hypothetical protein
MLQPKGSFIGVQKLLAQGIAIGWRSVVSNARIVERLELLADELASGKITLRIFAEQVPGQTTALDRLAYSQIKEAQLAAVELEQMADLQGKGIAVDPLKAVKWLRRWLANVPQQ